MPASRWLFLLLAGVVACGAADEARQADEDAIRALIRATQAANNAGDAEAWVALFEDDAVYMPSMARDVTTSAGLREVAEAGFSTWNTEIRVTPAEVVVSGDWAFARMRVTGVARRKDGSDSVAVDQKEIVIYRRQPDGGWRISRLIATRNPPP
ncbi:MAG: SgcJ/EcaC family oxidoreductase [Gemmatimonadota bacterium]|nr:SgcJ/EcaC family oxidoreductase [Gemmatimonadota bacterium]